MPATSAPAVAPSVREWEFVQNLLRDLQAEEDREQLSSLFGQWRLSIKAFQRIETLCLILREPTPQDILLHRACISNLISTGSFIEAAAREHTPDELGRHGLSLDVIEATLLGLRNTFDEWHAQVPPERISELNDRIFHAAPELNFADSRA